jgi:hypothetical protein
MGAYKLEGWIAELEGWVAELEGWEFNLEGWDARLEGWVLEACLPVHSKLSGFESSKKS